MNNYKLIIQYDGGRYKGWQRLGDSDSTIQGKIEHVLTEMLQRRIEITGCSRTDAGVHTYFQVANFKNKEEINEAEIKSYLNRFLPQDISIIEVERVPERFHARLNAKTKTYLYQICNEEHGNPFLRRYSMYLSQKLNLDAIRKAAGYFLGSHDFTAFTNAKSKTKSMERQINSIVIKKSDGLIQIRICGNGFLHNMVRRMVGVMIQAGLGETQPESVPALLLQKQRSDVGITAEACGLILEKIEY
jgi:tRNA pseudouridine38-40 synthase